MSEDLRVTTLVREAAPTKSRIRDVLERCAITGRKHTYTIVAGGAGAQKESIGLILNVVSIPLEWHERHTDPFTFHRLHPEVSQRECYVVL